MSNRKFGLVLDTSFIGGGLKAAGTILADYAGPFGEAIKPCDESGILIAQETPGADTDVGTDIVKLFAAKHVSRGDYVVERIEDGSRASVVFKNTGTKGEAEALAEAEANRLNAGGELKLAEPEVPSAPPAQDTPGADNLPDA